MDRKELLLVVLGKLVKYWNLAEGLKVFIESEYSTQRDVDNILLFLQDKVKKMKHQEEENMKIRLQNKITEAEKKEKEDIENIEKLLDSIDWE